MGKKVKLGMPIIARPFLIEVGLTASQIFKRRSGHFVVMNPTTGFVTIAADSAAIITGWALVGKDWTSSGTAGQDKVTVDTHPLHVWEMPSDAAFTAAALLLLIGDTCDIAVDGTTKIQSVDIGETNQDLLVIVGGDVDEQTLYVHMNPLKLYTQGVA